MISIASSAVTIQEEDIEMFTVPGVGKMNYSYACLLYTSRCV